MLAPVVIAAVGARQVVLARLARGVADLDPAPVAAAVFGSFARRDAGPDSDIDLLLVNHVELDPYDDAWQTQIDALEQLIHAATGNRLQVLQQWTAQLTATLASGEPLMTSLRDEAITASGQDLAAMLPCATAPRS